MAGQASEAESAVATHCLSLLTIPLRAALVWQDFTEKDQIDSKDFCKYMQTERPEQPPLPTPLAPDTRSMGRCTTC